MLFEEDTKHPILSWICSATGKCKRELQIDRGKNALFFFLKCELFLMDNKAREKEIYDAIRFLIKAIFFQV